MTTDVDQAYQLQQMVQQQQQQQQQQQEEEADQQSRKEFFINHTANYRHQALAARQAVQNHVGKLRYISISMVSALSWIFDNPANIGWNETTTSSSNNKMLGNGFGWGQVSHVLAWMVYVCPQLVPWRVVSCYMIHSETTSADVAVSATILCKQNDDKDDIVLVSFSGTSLLPGHAHSDPPVGKQLDFRIFGSNGAVLYCGDTETTSSSGISSLQVRRVDSGGQVEYPLQQRILGQEQEDDDDDFGFEFENLDQQGTGPESLQNFVNACQASSSLDSTSRSSSGCNNYHVAADVTVGLKSVQILEAMYRSHCSGKTEDVQYYAHGD
jgi:predicted dehydrogenase